MEYIIIKALIHNKYFHSELGEEVERVDSAITGAAYRDRVYLSNIPNAVFDGIKRRNLIDVVNHSLGREPIVDKLNTITQQEKSIKLGNVTFRGYSEHDSAT